MLDATDIVRLVGEHVNLRPKGREFTGLCPFHDDHNPSMYVVPRKQIYHCFVCGAGGDAFAFVMNYHRMGFREALEFLAQRAGIELTPPRRSAGDAADAPAHPRSALLAANSAACAFYRTILAHSEHGEAARELINRRAISDEMVERFQLGAAPDKWDGLALTAARKGIDPEPLRAVGLLRPRDSGGDYDGLRNRLVFPIHDQIGRVIAFGGRRIDDQDEPKYINSPETPLFDKSATLYGLHQAARAIQREGQAVVTEGYTDVIACHQAGFNTAVATLGTALTPRHAAILRRLCDRVVLLFDGDDAGARAADRAVEVFFSESIDVRIATLAPHTDAKDPDELLKRADGPDIFRRILDSATDLLEYRFARLRESVSDAGLSRVEQALRTEAARLAELGLHRVPPIRRRLVVRRLAQIAGVETELVASLVAGAPRAQTRGRPGQEADAQTSESRPRPARPRTPLEHLLACILVEPSLVLSLPAGHEDLLAPDAYASPHVRAVAEAVSRIAGEGGSPSLRAVLAQTEDPQVQRTAIGFEHEIQTMTDGDAERVCAHWREKLAHARRQLAAQTEAPGDPEDVVARIERLRRARESIGENPGALPRHATG